MISCAMVLIEKVSADGSLLPVGHREYWHSESTIPPGWRKVPEVERDIKLKEKAA